jgi:DMSO/TMAO reductase YedYZ molybdopterin-dependent catalytic subunit
MASRCLLPQFDPQPNERLLGTVPLSTPSAIPLERPIGSGLDARLFTDLSTLTSSSQITPIDRFYVRTACPKALRSVDAWSIHIDGLIANQLKLSLKYLLSHSQDMGTHLLECSGNRDPNNYGLLSSATWGGLPFTRLIEDVKLQPRASHVLIHGVDDERSALGTSIPEASWIFDLNQVADAFLATSMNGDLLIPDHGAPVRLIVPRWYGCACIKWVNHISFVDNSQAATPHMIEFAQRTHQQPGVRLARDFIPARIEHCAMPVRVEQWSRDGRSVYRVVGILWGGEKPTNALAIRFGPKHTFENVESCPLPHSTASWTLWCHTWRPDKPGRYEITLRITDPSIPTRRLNMSFYRRIVEIRDV